MRRWVVVLLAACHHGGAPLTADCGAVGAHVASLLGVDHGKRVGDVFTTRCAADAWAADVRDCVVATTSLHDPRHCKAKLPAAAHAALDRDLAALEARQACEQLRAMLAKIDTCTRMTADEREAYAQYDQVVRMAWDSASDDVKLQLTNGCQDRGDALRLACGW